MKTYNNLYDSICTLENLEEAYEKAKKGKSGKLYVIQFKINLEEELKKLKEELETLTYKPRHLKRFIVRDPKTRTIHASEFRDRVVYHALVNVIGPIFEKTFIYDSYASIINKGTLKAVLRFYQFVRKVTNNGKLIENAFDNNNIVGYALKADIKHYFRTVAHEVLLNILRRKIADEKVIWLIEQILNNYDFEVPGKGMPLGNLTSQFFANVYLNELDYFVKHQLKIKYYLRYVDDFIILHRDMKVLEDYKNKINDYLINNLKIELHPDKSKILPLRNGLNLVGYRNFYHHKLLRKSNIRKFRYNFNRRLNLYKEGYMDSDELIDSLSGWFGYAMWANTYKMRKEIMKKVDEAKSEMEK